MIGIVDVEVQAANPQMPLYPMRAYVNSPSSIRIRNVPRKIGTWQITSVQLAAAYPDNSIKTAACKLIGCVWVGTIAGSSVSGTCENGYTIYASGIDENGNAVSGYVFGKGLVEILESDGTITPGEDTHYLHLLDAQPTTPKEGDVYKTANGEYKVYQNNTWNSLGTILTEEQIDAIDSVVDERQTVITFNDGTTGIYNWVGVVGQRTFIDAGICEYNDEEEFVWIKNPISVKFGMTVTGIGAYTFADCSELTSVMIPNGVTSIEDNVFQNDANLTEVIIPSTVTNIRRYAFYYCSSLTSLTIPDCVTSIGESAFFGCSGLTSIAIPACVTSIGERAFCECTELTSVTITDSVLSIGNEAFAYCISLTSVMIGNGVTSIGNSAFSGCGGLTSIVVNGKTQAQAEALLADASVPSGCEVTTWNDASKEWVGNYSYSKTYIDSVLGDIETILNAI